MTVGLQKINSSALNLTDLKDATTKGTGKYSKGDRAGTDNYKALMTTVTDAVKKVSDTRSQLGAIQNRLDYTINNLNNYSENLTSSESNIRDTDMATEMVNYSKNNILQQAAQSMLAQANQSNQGVLSLLQ